MIEIISESADEVLRQLVTDFEEHLGESLYPGDARHLFLSQFVPVIMALQGEINTKANTNLLQGAKGATLDEYGRQYAVARHKAKKAAVTVEFRFSAAQQYDMAIPKGTRVTADGTLYFLVAESVVVPAQTENLALTLEAQQAGSSYNGYLPGQIATLVDPLPYVAGAKNTTPSSGGADEEADNSYRERIRTSYAATSTAGSLEGYDYFARTAHEDVVDIYISTPEELKVQVCVLGPNATATPALITAVEQVLSHKKHRPMTDYVTVVGPRQKAFAINLTYYIAKVDYTEETAIKTAVGQAVEAFAQECRAHLGGAINPDSLRRKILAAGGCRMEIVAPIYTVLQGDEVAVAESITVEYGGLLG